MSWDIVINAKNDQYNIQIKILHYLRTLQSILQNLIQFNYTILNLDFFKNVENVPILEIMVG